jgi:hypothetical protein
MKKLAILSITALFALATFQASAQGQAVRESQMRKKELKSDLKTEKKTLRTLKASEVRKTSKTQFVADFGDIPDVQWTRSKNFDVATFTKDDHQMKAYYDSESKLLGTTTPTTFDNLPAAGQRRLLAKYKGYTVGKVFFFNENEAYENAEDMELYGVPFEHLDHYFVELTNGSNRIMVKVTKEGDVSLLTKL